MYRMHNQSDHSFIPWYGIVSIVVPRATKIVSDTWSPSKTGSSSPVLAVSTATRCQGTSATASQNSSSSSLETRRITQSTWHTATLERLPHHSHIGDLNQLLPLSVTQPLPLPHRLNFVFDSPPVGHGERRRRHQSLSPFGIRHRDVRHLRPDRRLSSADRVRNLPGASLSTRMVLSCSETPLYDRPRVFG